MYNVTVKTGGEGVGEGEWEGQLVMMSNHNISSFKSNTPLKQVIIIPITRTITRTITSHNDSSVT